MREINEKQRYAALPSIIALAAIMLILTGCSSQNDNKGLYLLDGQEIESSAELLDDFYKNIKSGGPPIDGIPPIEHPVYLSMTEAEQILNEKDVVFVAETESEVFIYPQSILVWHEIVNEEFNGEKMSITYCPLTGSAIGYKGSFSGKETTFGTSGKLVNSNLVMYDRVTKSYWPQILGMAIKGGMKGERLEEFPIIWTSWGVS